MASMLRYKVSATRNEMSEAIVFRTLDNAYNSDLAYKSDEFFQMILCVATAYNHTELINLMLAEERCNLKSLIGVPLPREVRDEMLSTKRHLHDLKLYERVCRDGRKNLRKRVVSAIIPSPIFIAIDNENLSLVELYLRAGSPLTFTLKGSEKKKKSAHCRSYIMSAVEQACVMDQVEIFKCLVSFDSAENIERGMALHFACRYGALNCASYLLGTEAGRAAVNLYDDVINHFELKPGHPLPTKFFRLVEKDSAVFEMKPGRRTALHTVMLFVRHKKIQTTALPVVVRQLIAAGAGVNNKDAHSLIPLDHLMDEVTTPYVEISTDERRAIVETAQLLIEAGSRASGQDCRSPLDVLLDDMTYFDEPWQLQYLILNLFRFTEALPLKTDLICLFLEHGSQPTLKKGVPSCHYGVIKIAEQLATVMNDSTLLDRARVTVDQCESMLDMLCEVFRCLLLVGSGRVYNAAKSKMQLSKSSVSIVAKIVDSRELAELALYSASSAATRRLLGLVTSAFNAAEFNTLKEGMSRVLQRMTDSGDATDEWIIGAREAMQSIGGLGSPRFLHHLARRAIINALTHHRCLTDSRSLELHQSLNDYVLLKE